MIEALLTETDFTLVNTGAHTHYHVQNNTTHAVDLTMCTPDLYPTLTWHVMEGLYGSDHYPIKIDTMTERPQRQRRYNISEADWKKYRSHEFQTENAELEVQERYKRLIQHIKNAADLAIPKTNPRIRRPVPWWTPECDEVRRERKSALRRYQRTGLLIDLILYKRARAKAQYYIKNIKKQSWQNYISKITVDTPMAKVWRLSLIHI